MTNAALGSSFQELVAGSAHPFLTWRENLLFASVESRNGRQVTAVDRALMSALSEAGLDEMFTRLGLRVHVGRHGRPVTPAMPARCMSRATVPWPTTRP